MTILHAHHFPDVTNFQWQLILDGDRWALVSEDGSKAVLIDGPYICEPGTPEVGDIPAYVLAAAEGLVA